MLKIGGLLLAVLAINACGKTPGPVSGRDLAKPITASYVGAQHCAACHAQEVNGWRGSDHDLAMQVAEADSVLGDFDNARFNYFGIESTFYHQDQQFFVRTDGPNGELVDYPVAYTFGVYPLQQYLVEFSGGRLQALNIAWDSRTKSAGGQRWFHLSPNENIQHGDELHWTGINSNWNFMCADCHSTHLQKNYDAGTKTFQTSWLEINVACEACHGPASEHIQWARGELPGASGLGFSASFNERKNVVWTIDAKTGNAQRNHPKTTDIEIEACAHCHSRRLTRYPGASPDDKLLDNFQVSLLTDSLYHPDGQVDGEVYVYGSFVQSKMYHAGVTCSDCHEPHSLNLHAPANQLCASCHLAKKYDAASHHFHGSGGDQTSVPGCIDCHMPSKVYMGVDKRRDHSFRIPRPDLSVRYGVPNTCSECHSDRSAAWAAGVIKQQFGTIHEPRDAQVAALYAARYGLPEAQQLLSQLSVDAAQPAIVRATALSMLPSYLTAQSLSALQAAVHDDSALVVLGVALALDHLPESVRPALALPLLENPMRTTRSLAVAALAGISLEAAPTGTQKKYRQALQEYFTAELFNADRPDALLSLADLSALQGQFDQAIQYYRDAIKIAPFFTPAYVNFADFYRRQNNDTAGRAVLEDALLKVRNPAPVQHALGLLLVRQGSLQKGIEFLRQAAQANNAPARFLYVYALALNSQGQLQDAIKVLERGKNLYPADSDIGLALVSLYREAGAPHRQR